MSKDLLWQEPNLVIRAYTPALRASLEEFRHKAMEESNDSLLPKKFDPEHFDGQILLCFSDDKLISISAVERSHYTGDPQLACRICRYHVLKEFRSQFKFCGFKMLRLQCQWADEQGFKVIYWTHDVKNRPLNLLYQKKRRYTLGASSEWFGDAYFSEFKLHPELLFKVSERSDMLQFIYYRSNDPQFIWQPKERVVKYTADKPAPENYSADKILAF